MPEYTAAQIDAAARALHEYSHHSGWGSTDAEAVAETRGAVRATLAALDTPPPGLATWTPADGPLVDALADLPDGHPVTIEGPGVHLEGSNVKTMSEQGFGWKLGHMTRYIWEADLTGVTSASWLLPAPAWDGALVVVDGTHELLWRGPDGLYRGGAIGDSDASTASDVETNWPPVTVLIDADGRHVEANQ